jgi:hypothetical protein
LTEETDALVDVGIRNKERFTRSCDFLSENYFVKETET